jgi:hypothetical protein
MHVGCHQLPQDSFHLIFNGTLWVGDTVATTTSAWCPRQRPTARFARSTRWTTWSSASSRWSSCGRRSCTTSKSVRRLERRRRRRRRRQRRRQRRRPLTAVTRRRRAERRPTLLRSDSQPIRHCVRGDQLAWGERELRRLTQTRLAHHRT